MNKPEIVLFSLEIHPITNSLSASLNATIGQFDRRQFPDGESYLRIISEVHNKHCLVIADLAHPNNKFLPLLFLLDTLKELGAASVGLIAPYLSYMRQDRRFVDGEAITSKLFARTLSQHIDYLVTIDPHLHRYHSLDEIYSVPSKVIQGAPALANWLKNQENLLLVGPDEESEQWVADIARYSDHPFIIGKKNRFGDRDVAITLPDISKYLTKTAVIIDDVIASGQTVLCCISELQKQGLTHIKCAAVHGIFADNSDETLLNAGLSALVTTNSIVHNSNKIDTTYLLIEPIKQCINQLQYDK
jgi:ribose-phosphate pyrophosphokinase